MEFCLFLGKDVEKALETHGQPFSPHPPLKPKRPSQEWDLCQVSGKTGSCSCQEPAFLFNWLAHTFFVFVYLWLVLTNKRASFLSLFTWEKWTVGLSGRSKGLKMLGFGEFPDMWCRRHSCWLWWQKRLNDSSLHHTPWITSPPVITELLTPHPRLPGPSSLWSLPWESAGQSTNKYLLSSF